MVLDCPICENSFADSRKGLHELRDHLDAAHKNSTIEAINEGWPAERKRWCRCVQCDNHVSVWGAATTNHVKRCINYVDVALRAGLKYRDFFPGYTFGDENRANAYVIERAVANIQPVNLELPAVAPNGNLQAIAPFPAPHAAGNAPVHVANPNEVQPDEDAEVIGEAAAPIVAAPAANAVPRRRGRGAPRNPAAPIQAAPVANAENQVVANVPVHNMHGFGFTFDGEPSAEQLAELDRISSELSEGCYFMHPTHVRSFRQITDTILRIHLDPATDACLKKLAIYALITLPGLFVRLHRVGTENLSNVMKSWNDSVSPVIAVLLRARETLRLFPRRPTRGTSRLTSAKAEDLVRAGRLGALMSAIEADAENVQSTTMSQAELIAQAARFHPEGGAHDNVDDIVPPDHTVDADFTDADLAAAISRLPMISAAGASGWTFFIIRKLYESESNAIKAGAGVNGNAGVGLLRRLLITITGGSIDDLALRKLNTSRLLFVPKKTEGYRPIAIGDSLLRLLLRVINAKYSADVGKLLEPLQVAVGTSGGCEIMAALAQNSFRKRDHTLTLDLHSAFNQVWRRSIADGLVKYAPGLLNLFKKLYSRPSDLRSNSKEGRSMLVGQSMRGCKQGDPLSMLYFSVAIHDWLRSVNTLVTTRHTASAPNTTPFAIAYADDIALGGDPAILCSCMPIISDSLETTTGLRVTIGKCKLLGAEPFAQPGGELPPIPSSTQGNVLVGVPIGTDEYRRAQCDTQLAKAAHGATFVANSRVIHVQTKFALLLKCVNARPQYLTRNVDPDLLDNSLRDFDAAMDTALSRILGTPLDPHRVQLRGLPLSLAGCGLRRHQGAESIHAYASRNDLISQFLRSYNHEVPAMRQVLEGLAAQAPIPFPHHDPPNHPVNSITELHNTLFNMVSAGMHEEYDGMAKVAWLKSGLHTGAADTTYTASGKFLLWAGGSDKRWRMENNVFISALRRRLCISETNTNMLCPHAHRHIPNGTNLNLAECFGHVVLCTPAEGVTGPIINRHNYIRNATFSLLRTLLPGEGPPPAAALAKEVIVGRRPNNIDIKADIVFVENHDQATATRFVLDITIVEPFNRHGIGQPNTGAAVAAAAVAKRVDYAPIIREPNTVFVPFALDSNGHIGTEATAFLNRMKVNSPTFGSRIKQFMQEISYHLAKQTAIASEAGMAVAYQALWHQ